MATKKLPDKTVERLSQYRRTLLITNATGKHHVFSHELAAMLAWGMHRNFVVPAKAGTYVDPVLNAAPKPNGSRRSPG